MSTIAELVRANFREELVRWYRYRSSSSLPIDELYEHSPAARRYPMNVTEIPLSPDNQLFRIQLAETTYTLRVIWRDSAGWILDVQDSSGEPLLSGVPLVTGVNLLEQYPQLGINGALLVGCDVGAPDEPTKTNLGTHSHLIFVQE